MRVRDIERRRIAKMSRADKIQELINMCRYRALTEIDRHFMTKLIEDPQDGTVFDCDVMDVLDTLKSSGYVTPADMRNQLRPLKKKYI